MSRVHSLPSVDRRAFNLQKSEALSRVTVAWEKTRRGVSPRIVLPCVLFLNVTS